jgi:hypothetical protein
MLVVIWKKNTSHFSIRAFLLANDLAVCTPKQKLCACSVTVFCIVHIWKMISIYSSDDDESETKLPLCLALLTHENGMVELAGHAELKRVLNNSHLITSVQRKSGIFSLSTVYWKCST